MFGLFSKKDSPEGIRKLTAKATRKYGHAETRVKALDDLRAIGSHDALLALLARFEVAVEPGTTDQDEKAFVLQSVVEAGQEAVVPLRKFILRTQSPAWPLRTLEKLVPPSELVEMILEALEHEGPEYTRDPEKKIALIRHLGKFEDDRIGPRLVPFLEDPAEDVRFSAAERMGEQPDEGCIEPLIDALLQAKEDSSMRMSRAVALALAQGEYSIKGHTARVDEALPDGFLVSKGVVKARGK